LQITTVYCLFRPDDGHMLEHFWAVGRATKIPIMIHNVVSWSYLSSALSIRILKEVPQVVGVKQSVGDMKLLAGFLLGRPARPGYSRPWMP
jgi:4-hydroxy-tetrahydrodipicolinate synthase